MTWNCISLPKNKIVLQSSLLSSFILLPHQHIKKEKNLDGGIVAIFQTSFMNNLFGFFKKKQKLVTQKKKKLKIDTCGTNKFLDSNNNIDYYFNEITKHYVQLHPYTAKILKVSYHF